jgi:hypothetical protein
MSFLSVVDDLNCRNSLTMDGAVKGSYVESTAPNPASSVGSKIPSRIPYALQGRSRRNCARSRDETSSRSESSAVRFIAILAGVGKWDIPDPCASTTDGPNIAYYYAIGEVLR